MLYNSVLLFCLISFVNFSWSAATSSERLIQLEKELAEDLEHINYPTVPFGASENSSEENPTYDVIIVGGGMAGLSSAAALFMEGIYNIHLFDQNPTGLEGPWLTYARMKTLRSDKNELGPALNIPRLTFYAWYEAQFGKQKWEELNKIPNELWMEYLNWFRKVLNIPVTNECKLNSIQYDNDHFVLEFNQHNQKRCEKAVKVVLATGRGGFGGVFTPKFTEGLSKDNYAHVMEMIDFEKLKGKSIAVIGCGASGFDVAAEALEKGVGKVEMLMRSDQLPTVNKLAYFHSQCFGLGYFHMSDEWRWKMMSSVLTATVPPPIPSLERVLTYPNFFLNSGLIIEKAASENNKVVLHTNKGKLVFDFLILATGYQVDGSKQEELKEIMKDVQLWQDQSVEITQKNRHLALYPYLGSKFQFLEKVPNTAPFLKDLHCFNHATTVSHGIICRDITHISLGAKRLAEGIVTDFLDRQKELFFNSLEEIEPDFDPKEYFP